MHLKELKRAAVASAKAHWQRDDSPMVVVSPYRFNPLGAHIDHQGGKVLARTLNQYTLLPFWPNDSSSQISLNANSDWPAPNVVFSPGNTDSTEHWVKYAQAAAAALHEKSAIAQGLSGSVTGTLIGAGLSSSASVVLAYLYALGSSNKLMHSTNEIVELSRQVENHYLGLNNGVMDQMSIVHGKANCMSVIDSRARRVRYIGDPLQSKTVKWVICYSGVSRELVGSGYNTRVDECKSAAAQLNSSAEVLGDLDHTLFAGDLRQSLAALPIPLAKRARHYFSESQRVRDGERLWQNADFAQFGKLMNASCQSSINNYECGSQTLIDLHEIASSLSGVYGSRFGGGGYGGCLIMLADAEYAESICEQIIEQYLRAYPKHTSASAFIAEPEGGIRIEEA